jgi:hypothetical protein
MASQLLQQALQIIRQYNVRLTVRQIYYRLVAAGIIRNTRSSYNVLDKVLTNGRLSGEIPIDVIEDHSRSFQHGDKACYETPEKFMDWRLQALKDSGSQYDMPYWLDQPRYVEVWIEKDALASLVGQACSRYKVRLAPCKGYPSLSFIHQATQHLQRVDKPITILYFGDFDMRGKDIERYICERLDNFGVDAEVRRVALTRQQVEQYSLPPQPAKKQDTLARKWLETQGDVAWELDALEPNVLLDLVKRSILDILDRDVLNKRNVLLKENRQTVQKIVDQIFEGLD